MGIQDRKIAKDSKRDSNPDPITGEPGAHPIGVGVGAGAGGAAAGAAVGTVAGPVGTLVGAAVGAVVGGLAGKAAAEAFDPTAEDTYWEANYHKEPYYEKGRSYNDYANAYRTGYEGRTRHNLRTFEEAEGDLRMDYHRRGDSSSLPWEKSKHAARAAWDRVERALPGDADRDGR